MVETKIVGKVKLVAMMRERRAIIDLSDARRQKFYPYKCPSCWRRFRVSDQRRTHVILDHEALPNAKAK